MRGEDLHRFQAARTAYAVQRYYAGMTGAHLAVRKVAAEYTVMTRGIEAESQPFWVSNYASDQPVHREAIAAEAESVAARLRRSA
jgi:hypothetical protein